MQPDASQIAFQKPQINSIIELLNALRDIHTPPKVEWYYPIPPIFWIILILIAAYFIYNRYFSYESRSRKIKLKALLMLEKAFENYGSLNSSAMFCQEVSLVLKKVAIFKFGKRKIGGLYGTAWVNFIKEASKSSIIDKNITYMLTYLPYAPKDKADKYTVYNKRLFSMAKIWIEEVVG